MISYLTGTFTSPEALETCKFTSSQHTTSVKGGCWITYLTGTFTSPEALETLVLLELTMTYWLVPPGTLGT